MVFLQEIPSIWFKGLFFAAAAFALFMALIPGHADPTGFMNDKVKHALTFLVLFAMMDMAFPTEGMPLWKPACLLGFGMLIEVFQKMTGYREFSMGDIIADLLGIGGYLLVRFIAY